MGINVSLINPEQIKNFLAQRLICQGIPCHGVAILVEEPAVVLQDCDVYKVIQTNRHGEASRRVPRIFTVALHNVRRDGLNPALVDLPDPWS
jgi:hypothetical protein